MKSLTTVFAVLVLTLALAAPALGQSASRDGYVDSGSQVLSQVQDDGTPPSANSGSTLPFTGLDVGLLAAAGGLLVAAGLGMRRLTRPPHSA